MKQSPYVVEMLEWFDKPHYTAIVMDCCLTDLTRFSPGTDEETARAFMRQAVKAVQSCIERGVFINNLQKDNIMFNRRTRELKLTDFSCCSTFTADGYETCEYRGKQSFLRQNAYLQTGLFYSRSENAFLTGAPQYIPPEVFNMPRFHAVPTNVWQLGLLLYEMFHGCLPNMPLRLCPVVSEGELRVTCCEGVGHYLS